MCRARSTSVMSVPAGSLSPPRRPDKRSRALWGGQVRPAAKICLDCMIFVCHPTWRHLLQYRDAFNYIDPPDEGSPRPHAAGHFDRCSSTALPIECPFVAALGMLYSSIHLSSRSTHVGQQFLKNSRIYRLDQVIVDTSLQRLAFVFLSSSPCNGNYRNAFAPLLLPDAAAHFVTV